MKPTMLKKTFLSLLEVSQKKYFWDIVILFGIILFSTFLYFPLFQGEYLSINYGDWIHQAERIRNISRQGFVSWSHDQAGGISPWSGYQFVSQSLGAITSKMLSLSIPKTMLLLSYCAITSIHLILYFILRKLRISKLNSSLAVLLSYSISHLYLSPLLDYSYLFGIVGFALIFPLFLSNNHTLKRTGILGILSGVVFYIHPIPGFLLSLTLVISAFFSRFDNTFIKRNILLLLLSSSLYWLPILFHPIGYSDPYNSSIERIQGMTPEYYLGLSPIIIFVFLVILFRLRKTGISHPQKIMGTMIVLYFVLFFLTTFGLLPPIILRTQPVRWGASIGIITILFIGVSSRYIKFSYWYYILIVAGIVSALSIHQKYFPLASDTHIAESFSSRIENIHTTKNNKLLSTDTASLLYFSDNNIRFAMSYFSEGDYSLLTRPMYWFLHSHEQYSFHDTKNIDLLEDYLKTLSISHLMLTNNTLEYADFVELTKDNPYTLVNNDSTSSIFTPPWPQINAFVAPCDEIRGIEFNKESFYNGEIRDPLVSKWANLMYADTSIPIEVKYPTPETLEVVIPDVPDRYCLAIQENNFGNWTANSDPLGAFEVEVVGPSYIGIELPQTNLEFTISLKHHYSWTWYAGIGGIILGIGLTISHTLKASKEAKMKKVQKKRK